MSTTPESTTDILPVAEDQQSEPVEQAADLEADPAVEEPAGRSSTRCRSSPGWPCRPRPASGAV
jgi:hypothetical protein